MTNFPQKKSTMLAVFLALGHRPPNILKVVFLSPVYFPENIICIYHIRISKYTISHLKLTLKPKKSAQTKSTRSKGGA